MLCRVVAIGADRGRVHDDGAYARMSQPGNELAARSVFNQLGHDGKSRIDRRANRRMQVQMPALRPGAGEERRGGRDHHVGTRGFGGAGQRAAFAAEHAIEVGVDVALARADRADVADAKHQVHRQRCRIGHHVLRQGVQQVGHDFDRAGLVAMYADRDQHRRPCGRSHASLDGQDTVARLRDRVAGRREALRDRAEIRFSKGAYRFRQRRRGTSRCHVSAHALTPPPCCWSLPTTPTHRASPVPGQRPSDSPTGPACWPLPRPLRQRHGH